MQERKKKGVRLELTKNKLIIDGEITINWRKIYIFVTFILIVILIVASSINADIRNMLLEILIGTLQLGFFQKPKRL